MNRKWLLIPVALAALGGLWVLAGGKLELAPLRTAIGLKPAGMERPKAKPICSSPVNPNVAAPTDCVPQHLANLPPDPGPSGMKTLAGIDSDNDGVRDDVQRYIALKYGHSERAVMALRMIAKGAQQQILIGGSVSPDEAKRIAEAVMRPVDCFSVSVDKSIRYSGAVEKLISVVTNTPERFAAKGKFEVLAANRVYELSNDSPSMLCGYDPDKLAN